MTSPIYPTVDPTSGRLNPKTEANYVLAADLTAALADTVKVNAPATITAAHTFSAAPTVPTPTDVGHAATKAYVDAQSAAPNATTSTPGKVQLAGDLGGTYAAPTVPSLANKAASKPGMYDAYAGLSSPPANAQSGQAYSYPAGTEPATISNGKLTNGATTGAAATYPQLDLGATVTRIGGRFTFTTGLASGSIDLVIWKESIVTSWPTIPNSPCHWAITPTTSIFSIWDRAPGSNLVTLATDQFATPLTQDDTTEYWAEATIEGNTATLRLPDGTIRTVTDSRIGSKAGNFACFEIYQGNAATETKGKWVRTWADTSTPRPEDPYLTPAQGRDLVRLATTSKVTTVEWLPGTASDVAVPTAETDASANLTVTFTAPQSGKAIAALEGYLAFSSASNVYWGLTSNGAAAAWLKHVAAGSSGLYRATRVLTGLTPGSTYVMKWRHWASVVSTATLKANSPSGYGPSITITPI